MKKETQAQLGAHAVMFSVMKRKKDVVALLVRNGIEASVNDTDMQLSQKVTALAKTSATFRKEFMSLIGQPDFAAACATTFASMNGAFANAGGDPNPFTTLLNGSSNLNTLPSGGSFADEDADPPKGGSWFTAANITNTLGTALNAYLTLDKNKTDRDLASAGVKITQAQSSGIGSGTSLPVAQSSNTALYIGLGILVVSLAGVAIYFATKKK